MKGIGFIPDVIKVKRAASRALYKARPRARETPLTNPIQRLETIVRRGKEHEIYRFPADAAFKRGGRFAKKLSPQEKFDRLGLNPKLRP